MSEKQQVRYTGEATGRVVGPLDDPALSQEYHFRAEAGHVLPLALADREWFETYPGGEFVIEPAAKA